MFFTVLTRRRMLHTVSLLLASMALALLWPAIAPAADSALPLKVFILAGQSNMEGQAVSDLDGKDYNGGKGTLNFLLRDPDQAVNVA